jgi:hypothetical protein
VALGCILASQYLFLGAQFRGRWLFLFSSGDLASFRYSERATPFYTLWLPSLFRVAHLLPLLAQALVFS